MGMAFMHLSHHQETSLWTECWLLVLWILNSPSRSSSVLRTLAWHIHCHCDIIQTTSDRGMSLKQQETGLVAILLSLQLWNSSRIMLSQYTISYSRFCCERPENT